MVILEIKIFEFLMAINFQNRFHLKTTQVNKKNFVKKQKMLNRFGVESGALSLKMHLVLPNWMEF